MYCSIFRTQFWKPAFAPVLTWTFTRAVTLRGVRLTGKSATRIRVWDDHSGFPRALTKRWLLLTGSAWSGPKKTVTFATALMSGCSTMASALKVAT
ncbi:hypothetical protein AB0N37_33070 [Streptomyces griseoincarnatus]